MEQNKPLPKAAAPDRPIRRAALISGILLIVLSFFHSIIGLNEILADIRMGDISKASSVRILITWAFAGLSLFLLGAWLLFLRGDLKKGSRKAWWQALFLSGLLSVFGAGCWFFFPAQTWLAGFLMIGLILFIPLLVYARDYFSRR